MKIAAEKCACGGFVELREEVLICLSCGKSIPWTNIKAKQKEVLVKGARDVPDILITTKAADWLLDASASGGTLEKVFEVIRLLKNNSVGVPLTKSEMVYLNQAGFTGNEKEEVKE